MNILHTITEEDFWWIHDGEQTYHERIAMRTILKKSDWKIAIIFVWKYQYYKLPWWWVEFGESNELWLRREIAEEVWCKVVLWKYIWSIIEYRKKQKRKQINHCYLSITKATTFLPNLTKSEKRQWIELHWV